MQICVQLHAKAVKVPSQLCDQTRKLLMDGMEESG